ncbi:fungal-specific transcription factor domain-containing protein [Lipomyces kononenkoae]
MEGANRSLRQQSSLSTSAQRKVRSACRRCRRQKLKCDVRRPCISCVRAGADCLVADSDPWKIYQYRHTQRSSGADNRGKRTRISSATSEHFERSSVHNGCANGVRRGQLILPHGNDENSMSITDRSWNRSSPLFLAKSAFQYLDAGTPGTSTTEAFPGGQRPEVHVSHSSGDGATDNPGAGAANTSSHTVDTLNPSIQTSLSAVVDLMALLPEPGPAGLLIDTYFDRVHWFMLVFHQDEFRTRCQQFFAYKSDQVAEKCEDLGFISTFLTVIAIGLQYAGAHRRRLLIAYGIDPESLKENILSTLRIKLLDIVSLGSLEAVQTCVLLGTYYLYHGNPGIAWSICGCALRIAQSLNLHRKLPVDDSSMTVVLRQRIEARKRCWWAVYEIETFCSMSYGYPHSIQDSDCDVEHLDQYAKISTTHALPSNERPLESGGTLLSYKYCMSKLSGIIKATLTTLYGPSQIPTDRGRNRGSNLQQLIKMVTELDERLCQWYAAIPAKLRPESSKPTDLGYDSVEQLDQDIGGSGERFESHIFKLQALALKLAYENARILIHRPLLSYRMVIPPTDQEVHGSIADIAQTPDPFQLSLQACRDAALETSELGSMPIFRLASDTYASAFFGIHIFTAGITLCILTSMEPLSLQSHESKIGLHKLMGMQLILKARSILAAQGLEILQQLTKLVVAKELEAMVDLSRPSGLTDLQSDPIADAHSLTPADGTHKMSGMSDAPAQYGPPQLIELSENPPAPGVTLASDSRSNGSNLEPMNGAALFEYVEDPAMSQALLDFEQALSSNASDRSATWNAPLFSSRVAPIDNGFSVQEQAWIWGFDQCRYE